jgi:N-acetyl sugar amidotransferase
MKKVEFCKLCVSSNQRPGIKFKDGICNPCLNEKKKDYIDWDARKALLEILCDKYRKNDGSHDCIIAVSGGKDSYFQVKTMKEDMNMNPLLITVEDNYELTEAGKHNIKNMSEEFSCDIFSFKPNINVQKQITRHTFEKYLKPTYYIDRLIYTLPFHMAIKFKIPLLIYGENISHEYGGIDDKETPSAMDQVENGVASGISIKEFEELGIPKKELNFLNFPSLKEIQNLQLHPIYLSYYYRWNDYKNYMLARSRGMKDLSGEWRRTHHIDDFTQVDSYGYVVHSWCKFPKFGHQYASDLASRMVKIGLINREKAIKLVRKHDHNLDNKTIDDFCRFAAYSRKEFFEIIEKWYNPDLFFKNKNNKWELKVKLWEENK